AYSSKSEYYQDKVCRVPQSLNLTFTEGAVVFLVPVALFLAPSALAGGDFAGFVTNFAFYAVFSAILSTALARIMFASAGMMLASTALGRIDQVMCAPTLKKPPRPQKPQDSRVEFADVSFTYDGAASPALSHLSFTVEPGQTVALVGPAGGGKTTVLVARIAHMAVSLGVDPGRILTITYNKESSLDMKRRFVQLFGGIIDPPPKFSTIHSLCYAVLLSHTRLRGARPPLLLESSETVNKNRILGDIYRAVHAEFAGEDTLEALSTELSYVKNMMLAGKELESYQSSVGGFLEILRRYEAFKQENGYIDFDDMLTCAFDVLQKSPQVLAHYRSRYDLLVTRRRTPKFSMRLSASQPGTFFYGGRRGQTSMVHAPIPKRFPVLAAGIPEVASRWHNYRSTRNRKCAGRFIMEHQRYDKRMVTGNPAVTGFLRHCPTCPGSMRIWLARCGRCRPAKPPRCSTATTPPPFRWRTHSRTPGSTST
ncbi:MAG: UvrD-helicase domain-containing protein, partial [Oscillospiraceae bacterium]